MFVNNVRSDEKNSSSFYSFVRSAGRAAREWVNQASCKSAINADDPESTGGRARYDCTMIFDSWWHCNDDSVSDQDSCLHRTDPILSDILIATSPIRSTHPSHKRFDTFDDYSENDNLSPSRNLNSTPPPLFHSLLDSFDSPSKPINDICYPHFWFDGDEGSDASSVYLEDMMIPIDEDDPEWLKLCEYDCRFIRFNNGKLEDFDAVTEKISPMSNGNDYASYDESSAKVFTDFEHDDFPTE